MQAITDDSFFSQRLSNQAKLRGKSSEGGNGQAINADTIFMQTKLRADSQKVKKQKGFSRNVRLTSNPDDFNSEMVVKVLRLNKIHHKRYNPALVNNEWSRHFQEIINSDRKETFVINKEFSNKYQTVKQIKTVKPPISRSKSPVVHQPSIQIHDPMDIKNGADITAYRRQLTTRRVFDKFHQTVQQPNAITNEKKGINEIKKIQDYVIEHYTRSMSRSGQRILHQPDYLSYFEFKKEPEIGEKYEAVKRGQYDLEKEEIALNAILKGLQINSRNIGRKFKTVGLINYSSEPRDNSATRQAATAPFKSATMDIFANVVERQINTSDTVNVQNVKQLQGQGMTRAKTQSSNPFRTREKAAMNGTARTSQGTIIDKASTRTSIFGTHPSQTSPSIINSNRTAKTPLSFKEIRYIWDRSKASEQYQHLTNDVITKNLKEIRQEELKMHETIDFLSQVQNNKDPRVAKISLDDYAEQNRFSETQDHMNFLDKAAIDLAKEEGFRSSVFIKQLLGSTGGASRTIWKPGKLTFTKIGPRMDSSFK